MLSRTWRISSRRLVPEDTRLYRHTAEGPDDMPSHIRSALTQTQSFAFRCINGQTGAGNLAGDLRVRAPRAAAAPQHRPPPCLAANERE